MSLRVLLVEDDAALRTVVREALQVEGYTVASAASVSEGLAMLRHGAYDLLLLDLGLPDGDGAALLGAWRHGGTKPALVISARGQDALKIALLDAGADDYLTKPFSVGELLARMRVALRHRGTTLAPAVTHYTCGPVTVDLAERTVRRDEIPLHLTPTEFELLAALVRCAGRVATHRQLLRDVWGAEYTDQVQYLRLYVSQLRAKLEANPAEPRLLLTEPGVGYRLVVV